MHCRLRSRCERGGAGGGNRRLSALAGTPTLQHWAVGCSWATCWLRRRRAGGSNCTANTAAFCPAATLASTRGMPAQSPPTASQAQADQGVLHHPHTEGGCCQPSRARPACASRGMQAPLTPPAPHRLVSHSELDLHIKPRPAGTVARPCRQHLQVQPRAAGGSLASWAAGRQQAGATRQARAGHGQGGMHGDGAWQAQAWCPGPAAAQQRQLLTWPRPSFTSASRNVRVRRACLAACLSRSPSSSPCPSPRSAAAAAAGARGAAGSGAAYQGRAPPPPPPPPPLLCCCCRRCGGRRPPCQQGVRACLQMIHVAGDQAGESR